MTPIVSDEGALVSELAPTATAVDAFLRLCHLPHCLFLDSSMRHDSLGRYSFVTAAPFATMTMPSNIADPWGELQRQLSAFTTTAVPGLPPFQGGVAGLFGYELNRTLETVPQPLQDEFQVPPLALGWYDVVVAFDHQQQRAWLISQGFPEQEPQRRRIRAQQRLDQFRACLQTPPTAPAWNAGERLDLAQLAPQFPVSANARLTSTFSPDTFCRAIEKTIDYIYAGDIFQANIAQRLLHPQPDDPVSTYLKLRQCNPAPFAGYFDMGRYQILSASPERFLAVHGTQVETRPIKGTGPRCGSPEADLFAAQSLQASEKDRAENVMIVDLLRNDLARVCLPDSVRVTQLCGLEQYQFVQHLVSVVVGQLAPGRTMIDLLRAAFPGGSITGAPKIRAMEIIAELEPTARGAYCGSLGYIGFNDRSDLNILIRTMTAGAGWLQMPVGGGIVAQSVPEHEYEETWHKAHGLLRAVI